MKRFIVSVMILAFLMSLAPYPALAGNNRSIQVNVLLNTEINDSILNELGARGKVNGKLESIQVVFMKIKESELGAIQDLPFVEAVNPDAERTAPPIDTLPVEDFGNGFSTWNLDAINVTEVGFNNRQVAYDGSGVYIAVLDTGLLSTWRQYFPEERIAEEYAVSFGGGGGEVGQISEQPNKWEHDTNSHGTHVTSTILGYAFGVNPINGVAPMATVIPVKVLNQNGSGWSSVVAAGITYVADLKAGPLADDPVVINMSLGGPVLDAVEKAAIDYAISKGVIVVASAGNEGLAGMGYPGAYEPVVSVAASGWMYEWTDPYWWLGNVYDPTTPADFYIADFSSRALPGQDLDVTAPGSWIVGPYQTQMGQLSYYYLGGTSMASPHVAGIAALMLEKKSDLNAFQVESILEATAISMFPFYGPEAAGHGLTTADAALGALP